MLRVMSRLNVSSGEERLRLCFKEGVCACVRVCVCVCVREREREREHDVGHARLLRGGCCTSAHEHVCVQPSVGAFISANVDVFIVVEAFAIRVLGALCLMARHTHAHTHTHTRTHTHAHISACRDSYKRKHIRTCIHTYTHIQMRMHEYTTKHTHTHTHTTTANAGIYICGKQFLEHTITHTYA